MALAQSFVTVKHVVSKVNWQSFFRTVAQKKLEKLCGVMVVTLDPVTRRMILQMTKTAHLDTKQMCVKSALSPSVPMAT